MTRQSTIGERIMRRAMGTAAIAALLVGTTLIAPQGDGLGFQGHPVFAAPGGNGNGADNGNGGNSGNAGNDGADTAADGGDAGEPGQGHAYGRSRDDDAADAGASELGRLNAAHASATARTNAAPTSAVGQTASYERAAVDGDLERAAAELAAAANKDIIEPVVHAVNELLGIDDAEIERDKDDEGATDRLTVHDTEGEIAARANGTFSPPADGDTQVLEGGRDS